LLHYLKALFFTAVGSVVNFLLARAIIALDGKNLILRGLDYILSFDAEAYKA